jgi:CRP/FNR family cyclic AMP-dependent transcriptional regulator
MAPMAHIEIIVLFQKVDLFNFCNPDQLVQLAGISSECAFQAGEVVYRRGDPTDALYCVVDGKVEIRSGQEGARLVGPAERFGVVDILSGRPRTANAVALSETRAIKIDSEDFFDLLSNNIEIVKALFRRLVGRGELLAEVEV